VRRESLFHLQIVPVEGAGLADGRGDDDARLGRFRHGVQQQTRQQEGGQHVDLEHELVAVRSGLHALLIHARIVHEQVQLGELPRDVFSKAPHVGKAREVGLERVQARAGHALLDSGKGGLDALRVPAVDEHLPAVLRQALRRVLPNPVGRPRDERGSRGAAVSHAEAKAARREPARRWGVGERGRQGGQSDHKQAHG